MRLAKPRQLKRQTAYSNVPVGCRYIERRPAPLAPSGGQQFATMEHTRTGPKNRIALYGQQHRER